MILVVDQLTITFKTSTGLQLAVEDLSFSMQEGEWLSIVGESGSGKSATALSVPQLFPREIVQYSGEILFKLKDGTQIPLLQTTEKQLAAIRGKEVAVVFQEPMSALNPLITIGNQIAEAIRQHRSCNHRDATKQTIELCRLVALPDPEQVIYKFPHQLSGGQKQRVMIAMAISCNPGLLICDEPTTGLDYAVQSSIIALLKELQVSRGLSILFITHDLGLVETSADRIMVMHNGKMVEIKAAKTLFSKPQHYYTKALLACRPTLYDKGMRLPVVQDFLSHAPGSEIVAAPSPCAETSSDLFISVRNLSVFHYKNKLFGKEPAFFKAVDKVNFNIIKGEILGLTGPSGSGKSTIGRSLLHLIPSEPGSEIWYKGVNLAAIRPNQWKQYRKKLQIIFQDPIAALNPVQTIKELLEEPMLVHQIFPSKQERLARIKMLLDHIQLPVTILKKYPHEFSGGQRQRISIARALILDPEFIICDEAVAALDVSVQAQILNLLNDLKEQFQLTLLFISHDQAVVKYFCDRVIHLESGKLLVPTPPD